jgi:hypothetical protein
MVFLLVILVGATLLVMVKLNDKMEWTSFLTLLIEKSTWHHSIGLEERLHKHSKG